jgi:hypothetical protein
VHPSLEKYKHFFFRMEKNVTTYKMPTTAALINKANNNINQANKHLKLANKHANEAHKNAKLILHNLDPNKHGRRNNGTEN